MLGAEAERLGKPIKLMITQFATMIADGRFHKILTKWKPLRKMQESETLLVPANVSGNHWVLYLIHMDSRTVELWDSLGAAADGTGDAVSLGKKMIQFWTYRELWLTRKMVCVQKYAGSDPLVGVYREFSDVAVAG